MTLPASGAMSLRSVADEFGDDGSISMSDYYRGGGLVANTGANNGIPTSGAMSLSDFYGGEASAASIDVHPGTYTALFEGNPGSYSLQADGDVITSESIDSGNWITPKASATDDYEVRATLNSGSLASGTTGSWMVLTTTRTWTCSSTGTANLTIEIRDPANTVQDSGTVIIVGRAPP